MSEAVVGLGLGLLDTPYLFFYYYFLLFIISAMLTAVGGTLVSGDGITASWGLFFWSLAVGCIALGQAWVALHSTFPGHGIINDRRFTSTFTHRESFF